MAPGIMKYYKDGDVSKEPQGEVELKMIVNMNLIPGPKASDPAEVILCTELHARG